MQQHLRPAWPLCFHTVISCFVHPSLAGLTLHGEPGLEPGRSFMKCCGGTHELDAHYLGVQGQRGRRRPHAQCPQVSQHRWQASIVLPGTCSHLDRSPEEVSGPDSQCSIQGELLPGLTQPTHSPLWLQEVPSPNSSSVC